MVSLKLRTREALRASLSVLLSKSAIVLDTSDIDAVITRGLGILDEALYLPRTAIFDNQCLVSKNGHTFVDLTPFQVDEIANLYYAPNTSDASIASSTLGVGIMPWLTSMWGLNFVQNVTGYLALQTNLNMMNRQLCNVDDYELWPVDSDGKVLLQVRLNPKLFILEYLPYLNPDLDEWYLYENEYQFLLEYCRCQCMLRNAENIMGAAPLGFGKEVESQLNYWDKKTEALIKDFNEHKILIAIR